MTSRSRDDGESWMFDTNLLLKKIGAFSASLRLIIVGFVIFLKAFESTELC